jgi:two-component system, NarL family, sensor histidine kinase UhpB
MSFSRLPLFWRVFTINAMLLVIATLLFALTPVTIHAPIALVEVLVLVAGLAVMLAANVLLLRPTFTPLERLLERMRTVDLLRPGQRLGESGGLEVTELVQTFNEMLERLEAERRESGRRALAAQEAERLRIARGLHDEVGQVLTGVLLQLDSLAGVDADERRREVAGTKQALRQALEEVRRIAQELRPEVLEHLGLASSLTELSSKFADQSGIRVERRFAPACRRSRRKPSSRSTALPRRALRTSPGTRTRSGSRWPSSTVPTASCFASSTTAAASTAQQRR